MVEIREQIKEEARKLEINTLYSSKGHFFAASSWRGRHYWLGVPLTVLSAATFAKVDSEIAIMVSLVITILSSLITFLNPQSASGAHLQSGKSYDELLCRTRQFRMLDCLEKSGISDDDLRLQLGELYGEKYQLDRSSMQIPYRAYKKACKGIENGEASYEDVGGVKK